MKKLFVILALAFMSVTAFAEATFDQIQVLIQQQNYSAAEKGLEEIIRNHPKSAKAFYAMAQAQAGLGNQEKAKKALDIATGLDPTLGFAPQSSVSSLKEAITPQVKKIESIEESHIGRTLLIVLLLVVGGGVVYVLYNRKKEEDEAKRQAALDELNKAREADRAEFKRMAEESRRKEEADRQALRAHPNYGNERFDPTNPDVLLPKKTKAQLKAEADALTAVEAEADARRARLEANRVPVVTAPTPTPPVVNNHYGSNNSGSDMLTGVLIGNMISNSGHNNHNHSHDTTIIREREVVRDNPAAVPARDSSWDTPSAPSRSSSWDDDSSSSSSKSSSSWSSSSSSDSSSSWSSSSSSDSSSSWD